jgi:4-hydroxy-3-polyprenylbenzoate decarboxylase
VKARAGGPSSRSQPARGARAPPRARFLKLIAVVSEDVDLADLVSVIWGIFTRFDPACDVTFRTRELRGACPVYDGPLGIDATWKPGYPEPLVMDAAITERVDRRWQEYGI